MREATMIRRLVRAGVALGTVLGAVQVSGLAAAEEGPPAGTQSAGMTQAVSTAQAPTLDLGLEARHLVADPDRGVVYATIAPDDDDDYPGRVVTIDPVQGRVISSASVGSSPNAIALAPDGRALFVGVDGQGAVKKLSLPGLRVEWTASLGSDRYGTLTAESIAAAPGAGDTIAVSLRRAGVSPRHGGVVIIDAGTARPLATPEHTGANSVAFGDTATELYGSNTETSGRQFYRFAVSPDGVQHDVEASGLGGGTVTYHDGLVFQSNGAVIDPTPTPALADTIGGGDFSPTSIAIDADAGKLYYATYQFSGSPGGPHVVEVDLDGFAVVTRWQVDGATSLLRDLVAPGDGYVAYIDGYDNRTYLASLTPAAAGSYGEYTPLTPKRILDTRDGTGRDGARGPIGAGRTIAVQVSGVGGVPATGAIAVVMNVTAVFPTQPGYLTVFPTGIDRPEISNLNFAPGTAVANLVTMPLGDDGRVSVYNPFGSTDVLFDVAGYYADEDGPDGLRFQAVDPSRFLDTRDGTGGRRGALGAGGSVTVQIGGVGSVPAAARGVALNVTVTETTQPSFVSAFPSDVARPTVSNLNFAAGATIANQVIVRLPSNGRITLYNQAGTSHVIVDVVGYYDDVEVGDLGRFVPIAPVRSFDTREESPFGGDGSLPPFATLYVGEEDDPFSAYVVNVTATATQGLGFVSVFPYDEGARPPDASTLNYAPGQTVPNHAIARTGPYIGFYNANGRAHLIVDVFGAFL